MKRNDPRMLVARLVQSMLTYVPFMLVQGSIARVLPGWLALPWAVLVIYYTVTRLTYIGADWFITMWSADDQGLTLQSGFIKKTRVMVAWSEVGTLDVRQGWVNRVLGVHSVTAVVGADGHSTLVLEAVTSCDVARLTRLHSRSSLCAAETDERDGGVVIHGSRSRDLVPIGFTHGQFLLVVPFCLGAGADLVELLGIDVSMILGWIERQGFFLVLPLTVVCALAYGTLRSLLKYHGYVVRQHSWGYSTSGGIFQKNRREARFENVVGVRIERNPLMMLTGTCSLHLILATGRSDSKSLPLLPLIAWRDIDQHIQLLFPSSILEQVTRRTFLEPVMVLLATTGAAFASWQPLGPWAAGLIAVLGLMVANMLCVMLGRNSSTVWIDTGMFSRHLRIVDVRALREMTYITWVGTCRWEHGWLGLKILDRRTRVHWIPRAPAALAGSFIP